MNKRCKRNAKRESNSTSKTTWKVLYDSEDRDKNCVQGCIRSPLNQARTLLYKLESQCIWRSPWVEVIRSKAMMKAAKPWSCTHTLAKQAWHKTQSRIAMKPVPFLICSLQLTSSHDGTNPKCSGWVSRMVKKIAKSGGFNAFGRLRSQLKKLL